MDKGSLDQIRFCAFCPNICRNYYPTQGTQQREYMTPSALSYLAHAVMEKFISYSEDVEKVLLEIEACDSCKEACPYGYNISGHLRAFVKEMKNKD